MRDTTPVGIVAKRARALVPKLGRVVVHGASMEPGLKDRDWLVVRWGVPVSPGQIVVLEHPLRPGQLLVKRLVRREGAGWWVAGDNEAASDDSRAFGVIDEEALRGRVVARYWPRPRGMGTARRPLP